MLPVEVSAEAERDLEQIADYTARDNPVAAEAWVTKLVAASRAAGTNPRAGRIVTRVATRVGELIDVESVRISRSTA